MIALGSAFAVAAAVSNSAATLVEWTAVPAGAGRARPGRYVAGLVLDLLGWLFAVAALRYLPLFAAQSIISGQVALTVVVGGRLTGHRARPRDVAAATAMIVSLGTIVFAAGDRPAALHTGSVPALVTFTAIALVVGVIALIRQDGWVIPTLVAGACFSAAAVLARALHAQVRLTDLGSTLPPVLPEAGALVGLGVAGTVIYIWSLSRGAPGPVLAVLSVTEIVLPGAAGVLLLGDSVRPGWTLPCLLALGVAIVGTAVLAVPTGGASCRRSFPEVPVGLWSGCRHAGSIEDPDQRPAVPAPHQDARRDGDGSGQAVDRHHRHR